MLCAHVCSHRALAVFNIVCQASCRAFAFGSAATATVAVSSSKCALTPTEHEMTGDYAAAWLPAKFVPIKGILFAGIFIVLVGRVIAR